MWNAARAIARTGSGASITCGSMGTSSGQLLRPRYGTNRGCRRASATPVSDQRPGVASGRSHSAAVQSASTRYCLLLSRVASSCRRKASSARRVSGRCQGNPAFLAALAPTRRSFSSGPWAVWKSMSSSPGASVREAKPKYRSSSASASPSSRRMPRAAATIPRIADLEAWGVLGLRSPTAMSPHEPSGPWRRKQRKDAMAQAFARKSRTSRFVPTPASTSKDLDGDTSS